MSADTAWKEHATAYARTLIRRRKVPFLAEQLLPTIVQRIGEPHDRRSFGPVVRSLARDGHIRFAGYAPARTSHRSPKPLWEAA